MYFPVIKTDPKLPYHYIVGIQMLPMTHGENAGKIILKYFMEFTNDDVQGVANAIVAEQDQLFKVTSKEALSMHDTNHIAASMTSLRHAANANNATLHHFSSATPMNEEMFEDYVKLFHVEGVKEKFDDARIS